MPNPFQEMLDGLDRLVQVEKEREVYKEALEKIRDGIRPVMTHEGMTNTNLSGYECSKIAREALNA